MLNSTLIKLQFKTSLKMHFSPIRLEKSVWLYMVMWKQTLSTFIGGSINWYNSYEEQCGNIYPNSKCMT